MKLGYSYCEECHCEHTVGHHLMAIDWPDWQYSTQANALLARIKPLFGLRRIIRYNPRERIKDESVAEHIAFVALLVIELYKDFDFNLEKSLLMALFHDIAEVKTSDVPHDVKKRFPKVEAALREAEHQTLEDWGQLQAKELLSEFEEKKTIESLIVNLADAFSVKLYSDAEVELGNSTFKEIQSGIEVRIGELFQKIPQKVYR